MTRSASPALMSKSARWIASQADLVDRDCLDGHGQPGKNGRLACRVLSLPGLEDLADGNEIDILGIERYPTHGFAYGTPA